ncbi:hypothetical protein Q9233_010434, partial [Columba guinea]
TTRVPAALLSSGHTVVASVVSSGLGTRAVSPEFAVGGAHAHPCSEEPSVNFTLRLLDGDTEQPLVLSPGSAVRLEARVDSGTGTSLKVGLEQCYGTHAGRPGRSRRVFMVVNSHGCLHGQNLGNVSVQHRRGRSVLQLTIAAPALEEELEKEEVYVHCLLTAWGPGRGHSDRSCFYSQATARDRPCSPAAFPGEGTLHQETVGPLLVQKEKVPWYEGPCRTVKRFLLAGLALLGSALVAATLVGGLLALAVVTWRVGRRRGRRRVRRQCPFQAELQSVVRALVPRELEKGAEVGPDHGSPAQGSA